MIAPLPMGTVTLARTMRAARNTQGVGLEVRVSDGGEVTIYSPDIYGDFIMLRPGTRFYFDVVVSQESARDVSFETASYVLLPDKGEQDASLPKTP